MTESLRDLRLFVAAYEERSFTAAATRENATQSGVSQHIRKLEEALAVRLFARDSSGVLPTPAGESYYRHCIEVLRSHGAATRAARTFARGTQGSVVAGLMPTLTRCALAPALARFIDEHPNVLLRVVEGFSATLTGLVQAGDLDFAVVPAFAGATGLRIRPFLRTPETLVAAAGPEFPHGAPVRLADHPPLKLVVPGRSNTRRILIESYLATNAVRVERLIELDSMMGALDFVSRTDWSVILPGVMMTDDELPRRVHAGPICQPPLGLDLAVIEPLRRPLSHAASLFLEMLEGEAVRLDARWAAAGPS